MDKQSYNLAFWYQGNEITFRKENDTIMVNANEMAKPFGKKPSDWLETPQAQCLIVDYSKNINLNPVNSLIVTYSDNDDIWMQHNIAQDFAYWLFPEFEDWFCERRGEIMSDDPNFADKMNKILDQEAERYGMMWKKMEEAMQKHPAYQNGIKYVYWATPDSNILCESLN